MSEDFKRDQGRERAIAPGPRRGAVTVPSSKSIAHRELIAAALSGVEPPLIRGESNDTRATRACLKAMMAGEAVWPCGESGTTLRLLEPIVGVMGWKGAFRPEGRLAARPRLAFERKARYVIPGNVSSQFVSGLLMALPLADWDSEIVIDGALQSLDYVHLTEDVLRDAGISFSFSDSPVQAWRVPGGQRYRLPGGREVEGDWSQAAFFLAMGVEVRGLRADSRQGDRAAARLMRELAGNDGGERVISAAMIPDLVPALAARAALRRGLVRFTDCARLRLKESDRLESTAALVNGAGGTAFLDGDTLVVRGDGRPLRGGKVRTFGDHRIAMAAAVLACGAAAPVTVDDAGVVAKSYPGFWDDFDALERQAPNLV